MPRPKKSCPRKRRPPAWHAAFVAMLPSILGQVRYAFRRLRPEAREDAVEEAVCNACVAFHRLVELGKTDLAYPTALARYAVKQYYDDRRVGAKRDIRDVMHPYCQRKKGVVVERLDHYDPEENCWRQMLIEDPNAGPAETAAARIDLADWFRRMPARRRKIAQALAVGERTSKVAKRFRVTPGRIAQMRRWFATDWGKFQAGPDAASA